MQETIEHRVLRSKYKENQSSNEGFTKTMEINEDREEIENRCGNGNSKVKSNQHDDDNETTNLLPEFEHKEQLPITYETEPLQLPKFLYGMGQKVNAYKRFQ